MYFYAILCVIIVICTINNMRLCDEVYAFIIKVYVFIIKEKRLHNNVAAFSSGMFLFFFFNMYRCIIAMP